MSIFDFSVKKRNGEDFKLSELKGKVLIVVNTATGCGFTPQYKSLERLYKEYNDKGLEILDFPCNQFGHQAPGENDEIHEFCTAKYKTQFDQFSKIDVNGENEDKLFAFLKKEIKEDTIKGLKNKMIMKPIGAGKKEGEIKWNFTKFLVDRNGNVVKRYSPTFNPMDMESDIKKLLEEE